MIRLGVVGCGGMSHNFADRVGAIADHVRVEAAVDIDLAQAQRFAEPFAHEVQVAADYREVLERVDAVLLVLPHQLHHDVSVDCLEAGKHVLVEKPMANTEAECRAMIETAERCDRVLMVAYVMRYHPLVRELKRLLDSGRFGACFQMSIWTEQLTKYPPGHWTRSAEMLGGGQLFSHGCHYIDLLLWFLGEPVSGCHVGTNFGSPWMEREGTSNVSIKFENGAVGYHMGTWAARGAKLGYAIHAHCEEGLLEADFSQGKILLHQFKAREGLVEPHIEAEAHADPSIAAAQELFATQTGKQTDKELLHFVECIESGRRPETDGACSLKSLEVIWRMYEAEQCGTLADLRGLGLPSTTQSV